MLTPIRAEILRIAIPFRFEFRHALAERSVGEGVILVLHDRLGRVGHGECAPRDYVSGESADSVVDSLTRRVTGVLGHRFDSFDALCSHLARQVDSLPREEHAAFCAFELAALDVGGKAFGHSSGEPLGPVRNARVAYSGVVSASGKEAAAKTCAGMKKLGVTRAKVKVGAELEEDLEVLATVREILGEEAELRADANGAWTAEVALARLRAFEPFGLLGIEQPCAADDIDGLARVTATSILSVVAAAGRQFAARTPGLRFAEGSYGRLLLQADVSETMDLEPGGIGGVPAGNGLGVEPDLEPIAPWVLSRTRVEP